MAAQHLIASLQPGTVFGRITPASISHSNQAVQYQILGRERLGACTSSIPVQRPSLSSGRLHTHTPRSIVAMAAAAESSPPAGVSPQTKTLLCTSLTAPTVSGMLAEADEAMAAGADIVELRIDFLQDFDPERDLAELLGKCPLPSIVTFRPTWEGGQYSGDEATRLASLKYAAALGAAFIDIELLAANVFFAHKTPLGDNTKVIISSHDYEGTKSEDELLQLVHRIREAGADVVKFATTAQDITDAMRVLRVLEASVQEGPVIALAMAERGQATRILAPKYGGFLTFGALSPERQSAPGQPTLQELRERYRLQDQGPQTRVFGVVGNPISHSKSPALHNAALANANYDGVYLPLLVDDMPAFLASLPGADWAGLSVTIPHKGAALAGAQDADPVAAHIGAANTLVRQPDGTLKAYNTDWSAAIGAIERGLGGSGEIDASTASASPVQGKTVVVIGAGGAGRALAFGAASRGASVIIANRTADKAEELAKALGGGARGVGLDALESGGASGDVLVNTTSVGMHPNVEDSPVPASALAGYELVFDAVYTPRETRLLRDAKAAGCAVVTGDEMFVGQAAQQFKLFTGLEAPVELMRRIVLEGK